MVGGHTFAAQEGDRQVGISVYWCHWLRFKLVLIIFILCQFQLKCSSLFMQGRNRGKCNKALSFTCTFQTKQTGRVWFSLHNHSFIYAFTGNTELFPHPVCFFTHHTSRTHHLTSLMAFVVKNQGAYWISAKIKWRNEPLFLFNCIKSVSACCFAVNVYLF